MALLHGSQEAISRKDPISLQDEITYIYYAFLDSLFAIPLLLEVVKPSGVYFENQLRVSSVKYTYLFEPNQKDDSYRTIFYATYFLKKQFSKNQK